ncbi:MAG: hypothetical protein PSV35_04745 [bacterium]|nr:hypothetical protein [bacterium]
MPRFFKLAESIKSAPFNWKYLLLMTAVSGLLIREGNGASLTSSLFATDNDKSRYLLKRGYPRPVDWNSSKPQDQSKITEATNSSSLNKR